VADPTASTTSTPPPSDLDTQVRLRPRRHRRPDSVGSRCRSRCPSQPPSTLIGAALDSGASPLKAACESLWGYGGVVRAPTGRLEGRNVGEEGHGARLPGRSTGSCSCWESRRGASKRFYVDRGLAVAKMLGRKYVEFATPSSPVKLGAFTSAVPGQGRRASPEARSHGS